MTVDGILVSGFIVLEKRRRYAMLCCETISKRRRVDLYCIGGFTSYSNIRLGNWFGTKRSRYEYIEQRERDKGLKHTRTTTSR